MPTYPSSRWCRIGGKGIEIFFLTFPSLVSLILHQMLLDRDSLVALTEYVLYVEGPQCCVLVGVN